MFFCIYSMFITIFSRCLCRLRVSTTLTQLRYNAGPSSMALASTFLTPSSASCWLGAVWIQCTVYTWSTDPMPAQCWVSVADNCSAPHHCIVYTEWQVHSEKGEHEALPNAGIMLARPLWCWLYNNPASGNHRASMLADAVPPVLSCITR